MIDNNLCGIDSDVDDLTSSDDDSDSESSNSISLSGESQASKSKNKFIIKNISNIKEKVLKDLIEEFVDRLYLKTEFQNKVDAFEEFKPDWLKLFIEKRNLDSKNLLEMMLKHDQSESYFTGYIGYFHQYGIGTEEDKSRSFGFYFQASYFIKDLEDNTLEIINQSISQYFLATFYKEGFTIVSKDAKMMFECGFQSAQLGNVMAQMNIGRCYLNGYGTEKDDQKAFEWFLKSSENGNNDAQCEVALCYKKGTGQNFTGMV
jgi:hypothetical protein